MHFSARTPRSLEPNALSRLIEARRRSGARLVDLTESNPTRAGIRYPEDEVLGALSPRGALRYAPNPRGLRLARDAVASYYAGADVDVDPDHIVLTASTSEAYTFLFKLLCEPGDRVAVPVPSYPLFEHLARVECVVPEPYPLVREGRWRIDFDALSAAADDARLRAVVVVSPNNPTGSSLSPADRERLVSLCAERGLAIVCDEVFADFAIPSPARVRTMAGEDRALTFALSGLSKIAALPQLKLGWIVASGPGPALSEAFARLEFIADLFLSVASPVQHALPRLLELAPAVRREIVARTSANRDWLVEELLRDPAWRIVSEPAGWYAVLEGPRVVSEEEMTTALLEREGVLMHPGYFFDFEGDGLYVASLLAPEEDFREGIRRFLTLFAELSG